MRYFLLLFSVFALAQQSKSVDFKTIHAAIEIDPAARTVTGKGTYTFQVLNKIDTIKIDAIKMGFTNVKINDKEVKFIANDKNLLIYKGFNIGENTLTFNFVALPADTMFFVNWDFSLKYYKIEELQGQIWTQGRETSYWLPSFNDDNEKVIFSLDITFPKSYEVVSNGVLFNENKLGDKIEWQYRMALPISSSSVSVTIGHYDKKEITSSANNVPITLYYEDVDSLRFEPTYRYSKEIFDFLDSEIGIPYPWGVYMQVPVRDFIFDGLGNAAHTEFSRNFVVDNIAFIDQDYVNLNAQELAQQWFGNMVTPQSERHQWLQVSFKSYYALLAEREIFSDNYFYYKLYEYSRILKENYNEDTIPILNEKASLETLNMKGALALHFIRESIGKEKFKKAIMQYLESHAYKNVTTDDFLDEIAKVSVFDVKSFKKTWLEQTEFPEKEVRKLLLKNEFMQQYIKLQETPLSIVNDKEKILEMMKDKHIYYPIKVQFLYQSISIPFEEKEYLLKAAMQTNNIFIRQAVATSLSIIPESFRAEYETLLDDESYKTQEIALMNLWKQFPENRGVYVYLSKDWVGFQDKNLKLEHLFLAYLTLNVPGKKYLILKELFDYTTIKYDSAIRQKALEQLLALEIKNEAVFLGLISGTCSHNKQLNQFSKESIRELLKDEKNKQIFIKTRATLPNREKVQLQKLLSESENYKN